MSLIKIETLEDPRLDAYARLTEVQLRSKLEPEKGIFIAESQKVIERALDAGLEPISLLMTEKWIDAMQPTLDRIASNHPDAPLFVAPHKELEKLTGFNLTRGALSAFRRPAPRSVEEIVAGARRIAVLENITNHTNVGAIFRSAAALNLDAVLITPACYDPFYRRSVRVSMGGVFQIPWTRIGEEGLPWSQDGIPLLQQLGFKVAAFALNEDSIPLGNNTLASQEKLALVFGTEGEGLRKETIEQCDFTVRIPMGHGVDSLNVAAASAVAFWELRNR